MIRLASKIGITLQNHQYYDIRSSVTSNGRSQGPLLPLRVLFIDAERDIVGNPSLAGSNDTDLVSGILTVEEGSRFLESTLLCFDNNCG